MEMMCVFRAYSQSHDNVNFAVKLGYKGKDKKAQDKMKLTQAVDQAEFERQKVKYKSYGLNAVLDQVGRSPLQVCNCAG